jgi:L,D-transpeptidase catalytic domain
MRSSLRSLAAGWAIAIAVALTIGVGAPAALAATPSAVPSAHAWLQLPDAFNVGGRAVTVPGRVVHAVGGEWPYVAGQSVTLRVFLGSRVIRTAELRLRPSKHRTYGQFSYSFTSPATGALALSVTHARTAGLAGFAVNRALAALDPHVGFGSTGRFVQLVQQRLAALHFYIPQTGVYDQGTGLAIDAYHRMLRRGTSQNLDAATIDDLLAGVGSFTVHFPSHGRHAEGDLSLQLLALVDGSRVEAIYPISSGKPSTPTILGDFHVYSRVPGYLPDGMYYSNFFIRGYAIHGYDPAPDYPASHGCMRLPIVDAISVYNWLALGDWVDVYY